MENYLLLRSAEVTRDAGYRLVRIRQPRYRSQDHLSHRIRRLSGWGPGFGWYWHSWLYDPWDPYWRGTALPDDALQAYAEIVMLTPDQAKGEPRALQASDVIARLGPAAMPATAGGVALGLVAVSDSEIIAVSPDRQNASKPSCAHICGISIAASGSSATTSNSAPAARAP